LQWIEHEDQTYKVVDLQSLRSYRVFERWLRGEELTIRPRVLLTDQKTRAVGLEPFVQNYMALRDDLSNANRLVVAGYSFGDVPLNQALIAGWRDREPRSVWLIVEAEPRRRPGVSGSMWAEMRRNLAQPALTALGLDPNAWMGSSDSPMFSFAGLPGVAKERLNFWGEARPR
jgi:hypothetical protein